MALDILKHAGGKENIKDLSFCMTRLRFVLYDKDIVNLSDINKIEGVLSSVYSMGQLQVVIGSNVKNVYDILEKELQESENLKKHTNKNNKVFQNVLSSIAGIFTPIIPAIAGSGMIKGILAVVSMYILNKYNFDIKQTQNYIILNALSDAVFYFLPIMLAYTSSKVLKTNTVISMVLGASLCYPSLTALMTDTADVSLFGINIIKASYPSSVIPIIITILVLHYLEIFLNRYTPEVLKILFIPTLSLIIMFPAVLYIFGPIGIYIGNVIHFIYQFIYQFSPALCGAFIGGLWCVLVIFGAHRALLPIGIQDVARTGKQNLLAFAGAANFAQAGAALGVFLKSRNQKLKTVSLSASVTALFGITEPAIYGANLPLKNPMICAVICGTIAGGIMGLGGAYGNAFANQGILTIPVYAEAGAKGFISYIIGCAVSFFGSAILTFIVGFKENTDFQDNKNKENNILHNIEISSPMKGITIPLEDVKDEVFSNKSLGDGIAIIPTEGKIYAPEDCTVAAIFPTLHAIGLELYNGVEILIHVGINTVNLEGKYFQKFIEQGQTVKKGTKLISFDIDKIKSEDYDITTPIVITNSEYKITDASKKEVSYGDTLFFINKKE